MKTFAVHIKQEPAAVFNVKAEKFYLDVQMDGGATVASYYFTVTEDGEEDVSVASFPYDNVLAIVRAS